MSTSPPPFLDLTDHNIPEKDNLNQALEKKRLRKQAELVRRAEVERHPLAATQLASFCDDLVRSFGSGIYAAYLPIRSEISPLPLVAALARAGQSTAMPVTPADGQPLSFRRWCIGDALEDGPYGTQQPLENGVPIVPTVILAPLLAFDAAGWRLGYGGGFYDRTIADLSSRGYKASVIGLAYDGQKLDKVPIGPYDKPVDAVLCPSGLYRT